MAKVVESFKGPVSHWKNPAHGPSIGLVSKTDFRTSYAIISGRMHN